MKEKNKYIIALKTIAIILVLILGVLLPNLILYKTPKESFATSSFSSTIDTKLGKITLKTSATSFKAGDVIPIEIYTDAENIISFGGYFNYDKSKFETISIDTDIDKLTGWTLVQADELEGIGTYIDVSTPKGDMSNGIILTIYLTVIEDIEETNFEINYLDMVNTNFENIEGEDYYLPSISLTLKSEEDKPIEGGNTTGDDKPIEEPAKQYSISYNANSIEEISNMPENAVKTEKKNYILSGKEPSRVGYTFEGWNTLADGTGTSYLPGNIYNIDENLTLYAQWKEVPKLVNLYLASDTYKIGNTDITQYVEGDKYISRVVRKTTLEDYISNLETNGDSIQVIKQDGQALQEGEYVGTGMKLVVTKGQEIIELKIAVMGDLSGEGEVTVQDFSNINKVVLQTEILENEFRIAADMDENGEVTVTDFSEIKKIILSKE